MKISVHSNIGRKRSTNQDYAEYFKNQHHQILLILCDGVGGHQAGDVASRLTTEYLGEKFKNISERFTVESFKQWLISEIEEVNHYIYDYSKSEPHLEGMGTTLVAASVIDDQLIVGHVGDSRAYSYQENTLKQITEDHSLVNVLIKTGEITEEEGARHPGRNVVIQSIGGTDSVTSEIKVMDVAEVDFVLLCSDGLSNMLSQEQLTVLFQEHRFEPDFAELLIKAANEAGGTDNITVIIATDLQVEEVAS